MKIIYAGYGAKNTSDQTDNVQSKYNDGQREFKASNDIWGDPDEGHHKALFIVWQDDKGVHSAAATEPNIGDVHSIVLP